jgi:lipoprotein-releasing system permease protein
MGAPVWHVAIRQMATRRRQTIAVIGGVALGVTVLIVTISLFAGLVDSFSERILDVGYHVTMSADPVEGGRAAILLGSERKRAVELRRTGEAAERLRVRNAMTLLRLIEQNLGSELAAASPYLSTQALIAYGTNETTIPIHGILPEQEEQIADLSRNLREGSFKRMAGMSNGLLLGSRAAEEFGMKTGSRVRLVSLTGEVFNMQVVGVYHFGVEALDRLGLVNLRIAQALDRALPSEASGIGFQLRHVERAEVVARRIERLTGMKTYTWRQTNASALEVFRSQQIFFYVVAGFILIIFGFGVASILITTVMEKQRDIAVMRSFGFSSNAITRVFLIQGAAVAIVGSILGSLVGAVAIALLGMLPFVEQGVVPFESRTLPMAWSVWYFVGAILSTILASVIAAIAPARAAARLVPAGVLRGKR